MVQPNLFDVLFGVGLIFAILLGMTRGNGRETLHTFIFGLALLAGWLFLRVGAMPGTQEELARLLISISFYAFAMYIFSWALMGLLAPFMLDNSIIGIRGRFWAGAQALIKLALVVLGINLWYATHSIMPVKERLQPLPPLLRESVLINLSDRFTEDTHRWLAAQKFVVYQYAPEGTIPPAHNMDAEPTTEPTPEPTIPTDL
jgi:uncharacterized membrane protein required for colicin V production